MIHSKLKVINTETPKCENQVRHVIQLVRLQSCEIQTPKGLRMVSWMDLDETRRLRIAEGRRRLDRLRQKERESAKNCVHAAERPLPSPFASAPTNQKAPPHLTQTGRACRSSQRARRVTAINGQKATNCDELPQQDFYKRDQSNRSTSVYKDFGSGREAQLQAAKAFGSSVPEPAECVNAPTAQDGKPYITDGVVFTSYPATSENSSRTAFSIRREEGMRVDAMIGEAEGEDEKTLMIQSLRAMVDGLKRQIAADSDAVRAAMDARRKAEAALAWMRKSGMLSEEEALQEMPTLLPDAHGAQPLQTLQSILNDTAEALRGMRAERDALEAQVSRLHTDVVHLQTELAACRWELERERKTARQRGAGHDNTLQSSCDDVTEVILKAALLPMVCVRDDIQEPVLQEQLHDLMLSLAELSRDGSKAQHAFAVALTSLAAMPHLREPLPLPRCLFDIDATDAKDTWPLSLSAVHLNPETGPEGPPRILLPDVFWQPQRRDFRPSASLLHSSMHAHLHAGTSHSNTGQWDRRKVAHALRWMASALFEHGPAAGMACLRALEAETCRPEPDSVPDPGICATLLEGEGGAECEGGVECKELVRTLLQVAETFDEDLSKGLCMLEALASSELQPSPLLHHSPLDGDVELFEASEELVLVDSDGRLIDACYTCQDTGGNMKQRAIRPTSLPLGWACNSLQQARPFFTSDGSMLDGSVPDGSMGPQSSSNSPGIWCMEF